MGNFTTVAVVTGTEAEDGTGLIVVALGNGAVMDANAAGMYRVVVVFWAGPVTVTVVAPPPDTTAADDAVVAACPAGWRCCCCC